MSSNSKNDATLPDGFDDLLPFLPWALALETERNGKRLASSMEEMGEFYEIMLPRTDGIIQYLNGFELTDLPSAERNLLNLALSFAEVSFAVEVYGQPAVSNSFQDYGQAERFVAIHDK